MATITKTLLVATSGEGFVLDSLGSYDSLVYSGGLIVGIKTTATVGSYAGSMRQGVSTNRYQDWGVPAGALVTGIRFISATTSVTNSNLASATLSVAIDEFSLAGLLDATSGFVDNSGSSVSALSKVASDYVRVWVEIIADTNFNEESIYDTLEFQLDNLQFEITYIEETNVGGTISSGVQLSGTISVNSALSGTISSGVQLAGSLTLEYAVGGTITGSVQLSGSLSVTSYTDVGGTISSGAELAGSLTVHIQLSGSISSGVDYFGSLIPTFFVSGTITSDVQLQGVLVVEKFVFGTITGSVQLSGSLSVTDNTVYLSGTIVGASELFGLITGGTRRTNLRQEIYGRTFIHPQTKRNLKII